MTWGCKQDRAISFALPKVDRWRLPPLPATPEGDDSVREAAKVCPQQPLAGRPDPRQTFTAHQITHRGRLERLLLRKLGSTRSDSCGSAARLGLAKPNDRSRCAAAVHGAEPGGGCGSGHDRRPAELTAAEQPLTVGRPEAAPRHRVQPTLSRSSLVLFACRIAATHQPRSRVWFPWPGQWRPMPGYPERPIAVHAPIPERPSRILPGREGAALCPHRTKHRAFIDDLERLRKHL